MIQYYVYKSLRDILPVWAYLHKSLTYVVGLYREGGLIGCHIDSPRNPVRIEQLFVSYKDIFPLHYEDLQMYVERNKGRISYYRETSVIGYDEEGNAIQDKKSGKLTVKNTKGTYGMLLEEEARTDLEDSGESPQEAKGHEVRAARAYQTRTKETINQ